jgi:Flp pilus assembly pilin Flp
MSSQYKKTIVIGMDYSEFSGGITEINRKMGLLDAEFKRATAEADVYGDSTDKLSIQQEILTQKIELQKKKVEETAKSYDKIVTAHGYESKAADQADKALLNERTTLIKLEGSLKDTEQQIEDTKEENKSFGDAIRDVSGLIGLEANPMVEKFAEKFDDVDVNVGKAILTIGALTSTLGGLTLKTADNAKEIVNVSQRMGMTTDQYQEWDYIMRMVGADAESMTGDIAALAEKAFEANDKTSDVAKTFRKLGVDVRDSHGALKSQNQIFDDVVAGLQRMEDATKRNAIASDLLSTTGENIVPILNMTKQELNGLKQEAHDVGYVMGGETLDKFKELNKVMVEFDGVSKGLSQSFAAALLPMMTAFFSVISSIPVPVLQMIITITGMIATMVAIGKAVESTVGTFGKFKDFLGGVDAKTIKTTAIIFGVVAALIALAAIIAVISGQGDNLSRTMDSVGNSVGKINKGIQGSNTGYYASGTDYAPGGKAWVGEHGPELMEIPTGARITNAQESKRLYGGDTYNLYATIPAKDVQELSDIVKFFSQAKPAIRAGRSVL